MMANERTKKVIAENLKRLRGKRKAYAVAEGAGVNSGSLSRYERAERRPDEATVIKLAAFFNVSPEEIDPTLGHQSPTRVIERDRRYSLVEARIAWARLQKDIPADRIAIFEANVGLFKGEPTEKEVDEAWADSKRLWTKFHTEEGSSEDFDVKPPKKR